MKKIILFIVAVLLFGCGKQTNNIAGPQLQLETNKGFPIIVNYKNNQDTNNFISPDVFYYLTLKYDSGNVSHWHNIGHRILLSSIDTFYIPDTIIGFGTTFDDKYVPKLSARMKGGFSNNYDGTMKKDSTCIILADTYNKGFYFNNSAFITNDSTHVWWDLPENVLYFKPK